LLFLDVNVVEPRNIVEKRESGTKILSNIFTFFKQKTFGTFTQYYWKLWYEPKI